MGIVRAFQSQDMEQVLDIWLEASIRAHDFMERGFWESKVSDMRNIYLPSGETHVYDEAGIIKGFITLCDDTLAAIFVSPRFHGKGIGKQLMAKAKNMRRKLNLSVYMENQKSVDFYQHCGFKIANNQIDQHTGHMELLMVFSQQETA